MHQHSVKIYYKFSTHLINDIIDTRVCLELIYYENKLSFTVHGKDKPCLGTSTFCLTQIDLRTDDKIGLFTQIQVQYACNKSLTEFMHTTNTSV